ncbi:MAG: hypothetical protein MUE82_13425, partial [Chloroflexi bacterium]|nr:hypothetical protein [Chloroflexota bacterium]
DVFVWDDALPAASDIVLVSRASGGAGAAGAQSSGEPSINGGGTWVAFTSIADNLVAGDTNGVADVFLRTDVLGSGVTSRQSRGGPPVSAQYDGASASPSLALNADYLVFTTKAANAGATDDDDFTQVYGRPLGFTIAGPAHLSRPDGVEPFRSGVNLSTLRARQRSEEAVDAMSADGRYTVFLSDEDDLAADDVDAFTNVYRRDNLTGETILISRADGAAGAAADGPSASSGQGLVTGPGSPAGAPAISADGNRIAFASSATNLVPGDTNAQPDVFVRDVAGGQTIRASVRPDGSQVPAVPSGDPAISGDGLRVAFVTRELMAPGVDTNALADVYLRDLAAGTTTIASRDALAGDAPSGDPALDFDGSRVAFTSSAGNIAGGDANVDDPDVFVRDVAAGQTLLASRRTGAAVVIGNDVSSSPSLSDDGQRVAFASLATNLVTGGDANGPSRDIFVRDFASNETLLVSRTNGANGISPTGASRRPSISADGTRVVFETTAPDLVAGDQNGTSDVALRDLVANTTAMVSRAPGPGGALGNSFSGDPAISGNGDCVAFTTAADNLVTQPPGVDFERVVGRSLRGDCPFGPVAAPVAPAPPAAPAPGGAPGAGGQQATPDTLAPVLSGLRATPARFRAGLRVAAARRGRPATGTAFRFRLSEPGRVAITVSRVLPGKRVRTRCVVPRPGLRGRVCVRLVRRGALAATGLLGQNQVRFTGRLGGRLLAPGRYQARVVVRDAAGNASAARTARFTVLPRPR